MSAELEHDVHGILTRRLAKGGSWKPVGVLAMLFVSGLAGTLFFSVAMDPVGDFGTGRFVPLAANVPEEKLALFLHGNSSAVLVLGSSRSFTVRFPSNANSFNFALSHGTFD